MTIYDVGLCIGLVIMIPAATVCLGVVFADWIESIFSGEE